MYTNEESKTKVPTLKLNDKDFIAELRRITDEQNNVIPQSEIRQYVDELVEKADKTLREMMLEAAQQGQGEIHLHPLFFMHLVDSKYIEYCIEISRKVREIIVTRYLDAGFTIYKHLEVNRDERIAWDKSVAG